jgi:putative peptidoglycan lipid II flippase
LKPALPAVNRHGRTVGVVSLLTVLVALFGYIREAALAARFGLSTTMDAYFAAIFVPTIVYMVLIAGTLSPVFIPILLQADAGKDRAKLSETFSIVTNFVLLFLLIIVGLAVLLVHHWLRLLFPGFGPETMALATRLIYIIFPAVLFVGTAGILTAVLNGFHKFALAAFAPALSSIAVIIATLLAKGERAIYFIGVATAAGFLLQLLLLVPATAALGIRYRPSFNLRHPAIGKLLRLGGPLFLYLVAANGSAFVERNLASQLSAGAVSTLTYAMRLFTIPSNFLVAPLGIVVYPHLAREALLENRGNLPGQITRIFRAVFFIFLPVTIWTIMNSLPVTRLLFERGQFHLENSVRTAGAVRLYSIGILPLAVGGILLRCFYAVEDTITALAAEVVDLIFYVVVASLLARRLGINGLALTRGLSFYLVTGILVYVLCRKKRLLTLDLNLLQFCILTAFAAAGAGVVSWISLHSLQSLFDSSHIALRVAIVGVIFLLSSATFLGIARLLKVDEASHFWSTAIQMINGARGRTAVTVEIPSVNEERL